MTMFKPALSLFLFLLYQNFLTSQIVVQGKVTDLDNHEALIGATIRIGQQGSITDIEGRYKIELTKTGNYKATITFVGFQELVKNVVITEGVQTIDFAIAQGNNLMQAMTVTAGKFEKPLAEVTVSMDILQTKLIENVNTRRVDDVLQKVPGVNIIDGQANIRGRQPLRHQCRRQ